MSTELRTLELSMEQAKKHIGKMEALARLSVNPDFQSIIHKGYFEDEASRLVLIRADPALQADTDQKAILTCIDSVGSFRQYLNTINHTGRMAEKALLEDEETRDELLTEQLTQEA